MRAEQMKSQTTDECASETDECASEWIPPMCSHCNERRAITTSTRSHGDVHSCYPCLNTDEEDARNNP